MITERSNTPLLPVLRLTLGLELLFLVLLFLLTLAGGFTIDQVKTLSLIIIPAKTFYIAVFLIYLLKDEQATDTILRPGFTSMLRSGLAGHGIAALGLLFMAALGGILPFGAFLVSILVLETLFILFFTMTLPALFRTSRPNHFWNDQVILEKDVPAPPVPPSNASIEEKAVFYLKTGQTSKALPILEEHFAQVKKSEEHQTVVLLLGELANLETEIQRGQISVSDARTQMNRIRHAALALAATSL